MLWRIIKGSAEEKRNKSNAYPVMKQIKVIYREEDKLQDLSAQERFQQRQLVVKSLVALFVYLKNTQQNISTKGKPADMQVIFIQISVPTLDFSCVSNFPK